MKFNSNNPILKTDSYKLSHPFLFPNGMTHMQTYLESRGHKDFPATIFFGLQYLLKKHFSQPITLENVKQAEAFCKLHGVPFHTEGWTYIATELKGMLPVRIRAVEEGSLVPIHNCLMTVESTDEKVSWLPGHLETILMQLWFPLTVASHSYYTRKTILDNLKETSDNPEEEIEFKHHSFGYRGVSSDESAAIGGMAELLFSKGSDTISGILCAMEYYQSEMCGFSIPASEHSTITSFGKEHEVDAYRNMLQQFGKPGSIFACVSDSYDIYNSVSNLWGGELRDEVIKSGAMIVCRPDSGQPVEVVCKCLTLLDEKFGHTINSKGYKVLNHVRLIQGDGINYEMIRKLYNAIKELGYSGTNLAVGEGGGSIQKINRDTYKMAVKCCAIVVGGKEREVFKDPITDPGKRSKSGRLDLIKDADGYYQTVKLENNQVRHLQSEMRTVYENGELLIDELFETIRARAIAN